MKKRSTVLLGLLFAGLMQIQAQTDSTKTAKSSQAFTLEEAQKFALANSPVLKNSNLDLEIAKKKIWETTAIGLPQVNGKFSAFWESKRDTIKRQIVANIEQGIAQNLFRSDLDIALITNLYVRRLEDFTGMCEELFKNYTFEQVFKTMFESHIRGISNANGIAYFEKKKEELNY